MNNLPDVPGLNTNPPASEGTVSALEQSLGQPLPSEYRQFLLLADGASLSGCLLLYSTGEIEERNTTWEVTVYAPGYLAIGDTGGGDAILIQRGTDNAKLFIVGTGSMTPDMMRELAPSIEQWFNSGCAGSED